MTPPPGVPPELLQLIAAMNMQPVAQPFECLLFPLAYQEVCDLCVHLSLTFTGSVKPRQVLGQGALSVKATVMGRADDVSAFVRSISRRAASIKHSGTAMTDPTLAMGRPTPHPTIKPGDRLN